jgi:RsiW-degrading membrane proteinase PrsW (M82 family)
MKGLLLLLGVGAAIYTLLIYTHDLLPDGKDAAQTQPNAPVAQHESSELTAHKRERFTSGQRSAAMTIKAIVSSFVLGSVLLFASTVFATVSQPLTRGDCSSAGMRCC